MLEVKTCKVSGKNVAYLSGGEGVPLMFIPGWAANPYFYKESLEGISNRGFRVIAPFMPGTGTSDPVNTNGRLPQILSTWLGALLDNCSIDRPSVVVGHSLGGGIATSYVKDNLSTVTSLFLLSSVGGNTDGTGRLVEMRSLIEWALSIPLDLLSSNISYRRLIEMLGGGFSSFIRDPLGLWQLSKLARKYHILDDLMTVVSSDIDICIVGARDDHVISSTSVKRLADSIAVEPVWVEGTHSWITERPDRLVELITGSM